ncbi:hypothetical protein ACLQ3K_10510 [Tsukamurella sp. DT100]|uniref:hypothetical protein n=1 Tax=Tsukamurella sp. DT100 TaxID=3393415 RepID=UPI003CF17B91
MEEIAEGDRCRRGVGETAERIVDAGVGEERGVRPRVVGAPVLAVASGRAVPRIALRHAALAPAVVGDGGRRLGRGAARPHRPLGAPRARGEDDAHGVGRLRQPPRRGEE